MADLLGLPPAALTVAAGQAAGTARDVVANVAVAAGLVRRAADAGADVVVLPELFLTGYELDAVAAAPDALAPDDADPRLDPLASACAATSTVVVAGLPTYVPEPGLPGRLHISALVLGPGGAPVVRYHKQHLDAAERAAGFVPGPGGCTVTLGGWRLGLGICWDSAFPEHGRAAALDGCHAYLVGGLFAGPAGPRRIAVRGAARALDNAVHVVMANHAGPSGPYLGCGGSAVWAPDGGLLADAGDAARGLAVATLHPDELARARSGDLPLTDPSLTTPPGPRIHALAG